MQYEGSKFYLAESDILDALTEINNIITNVNNCISSKPSGYEYSGDLSSFSEEMSSIKTKITGIKDKVSELGTNLCNLDSSFGSTYMSYMSANIDDILDVIDEGNYQMTDNEQINDMIYKALLDLDKSGNLEHQMMADYIKSKFPDAPSWDLRLTEILFYNPTITYKGKEKYKRSAVTKFDAYELYVENSGKTIYLQCDLDSEYDPGVLIKGIIDMPESLSSTNQKIILTDKNDVLTDVAWKIKYKDFDFCAAAYGGDKEIYLQASTFTPSKNIEECYKQYVDDFSKTNSENLAPMSKEEYKKYYLEYNNADYIEQIAISTVYHENAHNLDYDENNNRTISNTEQWQQAAVSDGKWASDYAAMAYNSGCGYQEDFPESVKNLYLLGGEEFTKQYPNRAKILKDILPEMFE